MVNVTCARLPAATCSVSTAVEQIHISMEMQQSVKPSCFSEIHCFNRGWILLKPFSMLRLHYFWCLSLLPYVSLDTWGKVRKKCLTFKDLYNPALLDIQILCITWCWISLQCSCPALCCWNSPHTSYFSTLFLGCTLWLQQNMMN